MTQSDSSAVHPTSSTSRPLSRCGDLWNKSGLFVSLSLSKKAIITMGALLSIPLLAIPSVGTVSHNNSVLVLTNSYIHLARKPRRQLLWSCSMFCDMQRLWTLPE